MSRYKQNGQSLIEVILALAIGTLLIGASVGAAVFVLKNNLSVETVQFANSSAQELMNAVAARAEKDWSKIYFLNKSADYYISSSTGQIISAGSNDEAVILNNRPFRRYFTVENVLREDCGVGRITSSTVSNCSPASFAPGGGNSDDPSTQKITVTVEWGVGGNLKLTNYLTRGGNKVFHQADWLSGAGQDNFPTSGSSTVVNAGFATSTNVNFASSGIITASATGANLISSIFDSFAVNGAALNSIFWKGNLPAGGGVKFQIASLDSLSAGVGGIGPIDGVYRYAWNDAIGWIDFAYFGNVNVNSAKLSGYAYNSNIGQIALDCATSPNGDICLISNFFVNRDASGGLAGWSWNDAIGWISFCGNSSGGSNWDGSTFVCPASPTYRVSVDTATGAFSGWAWNDAIGWISFNCGNTGTCAVSDYRVNTSLSPVWIYRGPDGTNGTYYGPLAPDVPAAINPYFHNNDRYFRYKAFFDFISTSPTVEDIIINWSP